VNRGGATLPLHFEPRLSEIHVDEEAINAAFEELAEEYRLSEADKISQRLKAARRTPTGLRFQRLRR
jgi:type I restriction enzyme, R subunit